MEGAGFKKLTYYLLSQSDYGGTIAVKVPFFKLITFFLSILQNINTYTEKRVEYNYTICVLLESFCAEL